MRWRRRWRRLSAYIPLMLAVIVVIVLLALWLYLCAARR
jgi:hypothetical protein